MALLRGVRVLRVAMLLAACALLLAITSVQALEKIADAKQLKALFKARNNVLLVFGDNAAALRDVTPKLEAASKTTTGHGVIATLDCSENKETKKICKKLDGAPLPTNGIAIKHYKAGKFNKDYDRAVNAVSISSFVKDPESEAPWAEDASAADVVHLTDATFAQTLAKKRPTLVMFYAPWCGHCKAMKPDYAAAATELKNSKSKFLFAAIDANSPAGRASGSRYNISGFPTLKYFNQGVFQFDAGALRTKKALLDFAAKPGVPPPPPPPEPKWSEVANDVVHLTDTTFDNVMAENPSVLVMFYAPWCGHCKTAKPEYAAAALALKNEGINAVLAACDATEFPALGKRFKVEGYPTIVYFKDGKEEFKYGSGRTEKDFISFMKNPVAPPPPPPPEPKWSEVATSVEHLSDATFHKFIKKNKKRHTLVMFYAPWCGHCKSLKPDWQSLSESLADEAVLAAVDCTTDGKKLATEFGIQGFPTIKYFHGGKMQGDFTHPLGRNKAGLQAFLEEKINADHDEL